MENKERLIDYYSYYFGSGRDFIEEYLDNFKEMEDILKMICKSIQKDMKNYNVRYGDCRIMIENKKTKESYLINIEF